MAQLSICNIHLSSLGLHQMIESTTSSILKPIFHQAPFGPVGAGNAIYFASGTLQTFFSQIKI